ncbi:tenascin-X isoform X8 [Alligator sinensis]|uniref:Tenascin-X isoform X8 n=1 Tax=Alligator sinensis TaxID=38654 RepID=A0A3Q0FMX2_ALLSI|nr:tenascin-X isoform X8 [Alligator sinensis]
MGPQVLVPLLLLLLPLFQGASPRPPRPRSRRAAPLPPPANATIFSHVYNIRVPPCPACGDPQEARGSVATAVPLGEPGMGEAKKQVVLTHRINLAGPGCGCEADTAALRDVLARLRVLEAQVRSLRDQCSPTAVATTQAGTGQTDTRSLCSQRGTFDLAACGCVCEKGWGGPTCAEPQCPGGCGPGGVCVDGHCQVPTCPDDCNDQGRCLGGRCVCFEGYSGPACETPACPQGCRARGRCVAGHCVCHPGYSGPDCGTRACPGDCWGRGECRQGRCHCRPGFAGEDCALEIPSVDVRVVSREETSFRLEWRRPETPVDGYERRLVPTDNPQGVSSLQLPGSTTVFAPSGLVPGQKFSVTVQALRDQHLGPPTTLTVGTRIDAPHGLRPTGTTPTSLSLRWEPPAAAPERYTLQYTPVNRVGKGPPSHLDLPPNRRHVTLSGLESDTRYRITLKAHRDREASPPAIITAATASTAAPPPPLGPPPESTHPEASRTRPPAPAPPAVRSSPQPSLPDASPLSSHVFLRTVVQNITAKLSPYNGTFLQRLESYLQATGFPLRGNQTIPSVAQAIFFYLMRRKPVDIREMVFSRLSEHTEGLADIVPTRAPSAFPLGGEVGSIYSEGYSQLDGGRQTHTKPQVVASSPGAVVISLDGLRGHADRVVIRYRQVGGQSGSTAKELSVPGDAATVRLPSLAPGATYQVEIHGVVKGQSSKSYSIIISTAPETSSPEEPTAPPVPSTTSPSQEESNSPRDLAVTDVTADRFRVTWTATSNIFQRFLLRYRDTSSRAPPGEIQVPGGQQSVVVTQLSPGTEYELELWGEGPGGTLSEPTITRAMTAPQGGSPGPGVLGGLAVGNVTSDSFGLAWTVWQGLFDSFLVLSQNMAGQAGSQEVQVPGDQRATLIQGLHPATAYAVTLYGVHQGRLSRPLRANVSTAPADHPAQPSLGELSASDITHNSVRLSWTVPQGQFDSFIIQYRDTDGKPQALPVDRGSREVTVPSLVPSRRYKFHLYGISGQKRTGPISTDVITAPAPGREEERPAQPSLGELSASDITHNSVHLSWTIPQGQFDSFTIQYKDTEGKMQALPVDGGSRSVTIPNLVPSRRYKFNLYGISGRKRHGPISTDAVTARAPREEKPSTQPSLGELSASDITHDSVRLSWTIPQGQFDSFTVQYKDVAGKTQALPMDGGSRTVTVPNLTPSHQYKFNLYGVSGRKRHGPVSTDIVTASALQETEEATVAPAQPSLGELSASNVTHDSVRLSWTVPQGEFNSFTIQYRDREGKPQALPVDEGSHTVTVLNLTPSQRYKFNLYGISGQKRHGPISTDVITAPAPQEDITPQLRLGALTADNVGPRSLDLSWTVEEGTFDSFIIHYRDAAGQAQALPVDGVLRSLHLHDLTPSHQYRFNLYGISGRKRLGPISTNAITAAPQDGEPLTQPRLGDLSYYDATHNSVLLSWTIQEGEFNSFLIEYQDAAGQLQSLPADGTHRSIRVGHLVPSHRYIFHLYGISAQQRFGPVSTDLVTAPESWKEKPHLGELSVSDITPDSLRLSWMVQSGSFDSFLVQYKDAEGRPQTLTVDGGSRTVTISNLVPYRKYKFNLYGVASRKRHGPVSTDAVTASALQEEEEEETTVAPAQPSLGELSASDVTHDSVRLSWTVPQGEFNSFTVQYRDMEGKLQALPMGGKHRTVSIPSLAPSQRYRFKLYGTSGKNRHGPISTDIITAPAPQEEEEVVTVAPAQPSLGELTASDITHDSVRLSWTVPQGQFDSFTVQYKDVEGKTQALPIDGGTHTVTMLNLAPSQQYKFNLYGISGRKRHGPISTGALTASVLQEEDKKEPTVAPAQPSLGELSASDIPHDSVRLSWTVPQGQFDSFTVQYKDMEGKTQALPMDGGSRMVTVPNLVPSRRYRFNLYGVSGRKRHGPISTEATTASVPQEEETTVSPAQPSLGELSASDITHDSVRLSWTVPQGQFDSFTVQYKNVEGKTQALPVDGGSHTVTVPNLAPSRRYKFNLYGVSGKKRHGPISTEATTALAPQEEEEEEPTVAPAQPSLGELSASDITHDSVRLFWTVLQGHFDSFTVQYKDMEGKTQALPVDGGSHTVTVPNLAPSQRYKFNLYGVSGKKRYGPISTEATTASVLQEEKEEEPTVAPAQPSLGELTASDITHDSVRLSWTIPQGKFDSFTVQYKDVEGKTQALPVDGGSRTVTVPSLVPSRRYKFNLYGVSGRKRHGPISTEATTASDPQEEEPTVAPAQPSLGELSASDVTHDSVRLSWTVPQGQFDSFTVQYKDAEGMIQALPVDGGSHTVTIPDLAPSQQYKFNLYGVFGKKRHGPISTEATTASAPQEEKVEAPTVTPVQPSLGELSASDVTHDSVRLIWTVPQGQFDSFTVQYKDVDGKTRTLPMDGGSRTVTVSNLVPSRRYKFNLYGVSGRKRHGPISTETTTASATQGKEEEEEEEPTVAPAQPSLGQLSVSNISHDSVRLSWTILQGQFDSFTVQYKDIGGKTQALPVDGGSRTVPIPNLVPSQRYKFNLYGVFGRKRHGPISLEATTASVLQEEEEEEPTVAPAQPSLGELTASDITHDSVHLSWTVPQGQFDSFTVQYKDADGKTQVLPTDGGSRTVTIPNLVPSQRYKFNLYGVFKRKRHGPISTEATTASPPQEEEEEEPTVAPAQPSLGELSASDITHNSVRLSWTIPQGQFDSFTVQYKDVKGKTQVLPVDGSFRTVTAPNLAPARRYKFNLYGVSGKKRHGPISTEATTASAPQEEEKEGPTVAPAQPSLGELSASDITHDSVRLSWTVPQGQFDSFAVQYKDVEGKTKALPIGGGTHTVTILNLVPSQRYIFNLYGVSGRKRHGPVSTNAITASAPQEEEKEGPTVAPAQPSLGELSASDITHDSVRLSWTVPQGEFDSFTVQYKDVEGKPQALPVGGGSRVVTIPGLAPSHRYRFNLYGISGQKRQGPVFTNTITAAAPQKEEEEEEPTVALAQPSLGELSASDVTHESIRLSWTVPQGEFDSFIVQFKDVKGKLQALPVDGTSHTVIIPSLVSSQRYKFHLYGVSGGKRHGPISTDAVTASGPEAEEVQAQPSLGELSVSDVTPDSLRLSWTIQAGNFNSFLVQYKDADGQSQTMTVDGGSRMVTVSNLLPSHRYKFNIYGISGRKRLGPISTTAATASDQEEEEEEEEEGEKEPTAAPTQPSLGVLSASDVTHNSVHLAWTVPHGDFDSFTVQYKDAEEKPQALPVDGGTHTVTILNLTPSHRYKFHLYGISGQKRLGPISTDTVTAPAPQKEKEESPIAPVQPSLGELSASDITHDSVRLSWTVPQGEFDSFSIQYRDTEGKPQALPVRGGSHTVTIPGLAPSRRYKFNLYGNSGRKRHGPISTDAITAPAPQAKDKTPAKPSLGELWASDMTHYSVRLSWTVPQGDFDSFSIQYRDTDGKPQALPLDGGSRTVTVPDLVPSHRYKFNLYGVSGHKRHGPVSTDVLTATAPQEEEEEAPTVAPAQPSLGVLSASNITHDSVGLSWTVPEGEFDSFIIQYRDTEGKPQALPVDGRSRTATVPGLVPSRQYKFNLYGISGPKRLGPISTEAITAPAPQEEEPQVQPTLGELSASNVTHDSIHLSWTISQGEFDSFSIQYKDAEGKPQALPMDGGSRTVTIPNLASSRRYKFNLYGISGRERHGPISTDAVTGPAQEEGPQIQPSLGELLVSNITHDSVHLSWTVPQGEFDSFTVQYKDVEGRPQALPVDRGSRTVIVPGLAPSRRYKFHLYGISGRKRHGPISTDAVTDQLPQVEEPPAQPSLGELSASDITHESVRLSWTVPQGEFDSFIVQYKDIEGKSQALPVNGGSRTVTIPGLASSRRYKFHLYGTFGRKRLGPISTDATTAPAPQEKDKTPAQPSLGELSVSDIAHDSVRLSWTVPQGQFDSFTVQYKDAEGKPQALPMGGGSRTITVPNLVPSRRYKFHLYGIFGRKRHGPVSTDTVTASAPQKEEEVVTVAPAQPSLGELSASNITHDSVRLSWTVPQGAFDSFTVQYKDVEGKPQALPVDGGSHTVTIPDLQPSRRYKFNLYGISGQKRHGPISTDTITAPAPQEKDKTPAQPSLGELSVSDIAHDSVRLSWTVPQGQFDSFTVQYKDAEGKPQALPMGGGSRTITVPNLVPSRRYKFHLYGIFGRKRHGPVSTDAVTVSAPQQEKREATVAPIQPSLGDLSASDITHDSVCLSWTIQEGEFDSFIVQYNNTEGKPQTLPVEGTSHTVTVPDLAPSHRYEFQLYGVSGQQHLGPISTDAVTASAPQKEEEEKEPTAAPAQPSLGELSASNITHDSVSLSWTVPQGQFDSFTVQYRDTEGKPQALPVDGGSRTVTVPGLVPSRRYKFHLYGISGQKRLGPVSTEAVTAPSRETDLQTPPRLGELSASNVTHDSILLTWTILEGTFDSFIIHYRDASGKPQALPVGGAHRSFRVPSLAPSQRYKFNLYGISGRKRIGPISTDANTVPAPREETTAAPAQPSLGELSASDITHDSVRLSWTVPEGEFDSFTIQYKDAKGKPQALPVDGGSRAVTVPSLTPSRRYKFHLYGVSGRKRLGPISTEAVTAPVPQGEIVTQLRLGQLVTDNITHDSLDLAWTVEEGDFDSFIVHYRDAAGEPQALPVDGAQRSLHVPNLAPSRRYKFNLYGVSGRKRLGPLSTDAITAQAPREKEPPAQPSLGELSASNITHNSVRLSWTIPQGEFDSFTVQYKDVEGKPQVLPLDGGSRTVTVPGLASSRRYKFHLYGISGRKRHGPISTDVVTAIATKQAQLMEEEEEKEEEDRQLGLQLGDLAVSEVTKDSVRLSWTVREGTFDSFLIQYEDAEGRPQALPMDAGTLTAVVSDLVPSHRYQFHLYGISGQKPHGPVSTDAVTAFPEAQSEPPAQLSQLAVSEMLPTSVRLSWDAPAGEFDAFLIQYRDTRPGGRLGPVQEAEVPGGQRSAVLRGLRPSTHYSLTLHGIKGRERAASLSGTARTSSLELGSPRDLRFSDIQETSVGVSWGPPSSRPDRYKVSYQLTDGGEPQSIVLQGTQLETTLRGLAPGSSYEVSVMSMRGFEESEPLIGYVTTAPDGPSDLRAINITDSSAMLSWRPPQAKVDSYALNYGPPQGPAITERVPGDQTQHPLQGLQVDTEYQVSISGETGSNRSIPASAAFSTGSDAPRDLRAIAVTSRSAQLVWTPPHIAPDGYLLVYEGPSGITQEVPLDATAASHELQDLDPSSRYRVQVQLLRGGTPGAPITTSFTTGRLMYPFPRDCAEELLNGPSRSREVTVYVGGARDQPLRVYCDMDTDGGGWLVFQRRMNGKTDFWRDWQDYVQGFGDLSREFWLGNDALHALTSAGDYELRVDLRAGAEAAHAIYSHFRVDSPSEHYRLHLGSYRGTAGDAMSYHSGSVFSTRDHDPNRLIISCAVSYRGAWWYHNCHFANLNGMYGNNKDHQGINWYNWKGFEFSIPFTEMKIRPRHS